MSIDPLQSNATTTLPWLNLLGPTQAGAPPAPRSVVNSPTLTATKDDDPGAANADNNVLQTGIAGWATTQVKLQPWSGGPTTNRSVYDSMLHQGFSAKELFAKGTNGQTLLDDTLAANHVTDPKKLRDGTSLTIPVHQRQAPVTGPLPADTPPADPPVAPTDWTDLSPSPRARVGVPQTPQTPPTGDDQFTNLFGGLLPQSTTPAPATRGSASPGPIEGQPVADLESLRGSPAVNGLTATDPRVPPLSGAEDAVPRSASPTHLPAAAPIRPAVASPAPTRRKRNPVVASPSAPQTSYGPELPHPVPPQTVPPTPPATKAPPPRPSPTQLVDEALPPPNARMAAVAKEVSMEAYKGQAPTLAASPAERLQAILGTLRLLRSANDIPAADRQGIEGAMATQFALQMANTVRGYQDKVYGQLRAMGSLPQDTDALVLRLFAQQISHDADPWKNLALAARQYLGGNGS